MNKINHYAELYNQFINIFQEITNLTNHVSIDKVSTQIQKKLMFLGQKSLESIYVNEIGTGYTKPHIIHPDNNQTYSYHGLVPKTYISIFGPISIKRAYYYNKEKRNGIYPLEQNNYFLKDMCLPEVKELICYTSALEPFGQAQNILKHLSGIEVSTFEIQKTSKSIGDELVKIEDELIHNPKQYKPSKKQIDKMVISMDGAMINTKEGWKEVKSGVIYEYEKENDNFKTKHKTYISRIEKSDEFSKRLKQEAGRRHYLDVNELIVIGDGAKWIWDLAEKEFPLAAQIVDWYHAKQHLYNIIDLLYENKKTNEAVSFTETCSDILYSGDIDSLEEMIIQKRMENNIIEQMDDFIKLQTEMNYFKTNKNRMKYRYFREKGYPIGSGIIEAACKQLVQLRLKRNGMKWKKSGAHSILQLRCQYLGNRWDDVKNIIWDKAA